MLYDAPPHPRATLVMLLGGSGRIGPGDDVLVRTRAAWVARGDAVLIPDPGPGTDLHGRRATASYARVVVGLAALARAHAPVPVFLVGTSQGTIAAVNGAAHAPPGLVAGVVLTETVSVPGRRSTETVFDADPAAVRVPVLVLANRDDRCDVAPPAMAPRVAAALVRAPEVTVRMIAGGVQRSTRACGSLSPHGYDGIETAAIAVIAAWLDAHR